ncbi:methyl-accepting chemotaxis protein [Solibacillus sp. FSL R7-0668]|uniref:methyl-accepting chemotaxis protein n=1 Tax=Solibacillus sp. FSL R7-0668 TaxID=2921688 RepID=UPI0030F56E07
MSISKKLLVNSLTIIVLAVSLIGVVIFSMLNVQSSSNNVMPKFIAISEVKSDYLQVQNILNNYANSISVAQPQSVTVDAQLATEKYFAHIDENIAIIEASISTSLEQETLDAFLNEHVKIQDLAIAGITAKEATIVRTQAARIIGALNDIHKLELFVNTEYNYSQEQLASDLKLVITFALIGILIIAVVGGIFTILTTRKITTPLRELSNRAELIADGQLSVDPISYHTNDEIGALNASFTKMAAQLKDLLSSIQQVSDQVQVYSNELMEENRTLEQISIQVTDSTSVLSKGTLTIASSLGETVELVEKMDHNFTITEERSAHSVQRSAEASNAIANSQQAIAVQQDLIRENIETTNTIHNASVKFLEHTSQIEMMAKAVSDIADQTNLLALNASIEAARAGEHGKGFAVVAEEVRKLAEQSNASTTEIFEIVQSIKGGINDMTESVKVGVTIADKQQSSMQQTTEAFTLIEREVQAIMEEISVVANNMITSRNVGSQVLENVEGISAFVEETAAESKEISNSADIQLQSISNVVTKAKQLQELANSLNDSVKRFKM